MTIPMCWKCANKIEGPFLGMGTTLVGCKENKNITSYGSAMVLCPLIKEPQPNKTVPLKIEKI